MRLQVEPIAKPRMTQADKWRRRPCVIDYRSYCDFLRASGAELPERVALAFELPMPRSWSKKKRDRMNGEPHQQRPDLDNLVKAVLDALAGEDSYVHTLTASKRWALRGSVTIEELQASNGVSRSA